MNLKKTAPITSAMVLLALILGASASATQAAPATAIFVRTDTSTQGTWKSTYGADGYSIANSASVNIPSYAAFLPEGEANWVWASSTSDPRALESGTSSVSTNRLATCWYTGFGAFDLDVNFTDGNTHQVALYAVDWDNKGRSETIQVLDPSTETVLSTQSISAFTNGVYIVWNVSGHVEFQLTSVTGPNAVISSIFFQPTTAAGPKAPVASFVASDTNTQGNWRGVYGADGYWVAQDTAAIPSYSAFSPENQWNWTWNPDPNDPRAPENAARSGRLASAWYNPGSFTLNVNVTDGQTHQFAIYAVDWDSRGRAESIQVTDANTNAVLDKRSIFSFTNGIYLVWNISGHVNITVTCTAGPNGVVSAVFWGTGTPSAPTNTSSSVTPPPTTNNATVTTTNTVTTSNTSTSNNSTTNSSSSGSSGGSSSGSSGGSSGGSTTPPAQGQLSISPASYNFGSLNVGASVSQSFSITNTGNASVTFSSVTIAGAGFNASGISNGVILAAGKATTVQVTFAPAAAGQFTGGIQLSSNASNSSLAISFSGTGTQPAPVNYSVSLSWSPSSSSGVVGYDVYRGTVSGGPYTTLTSSPDASTTYSDSTAQTGQTYYYVVTSVDSGNVQSGYSSPVSVTVP